MHSLRKLHKENNFLVKSQNYILSLEPSLKDILKNELYTAQTVGKDFTQDKYQ